MKEQHKKIIYGKGDIWAAIVAHSVNIWDEELVTFRLHYPRFIHEEFMTHRMFSRNASSSRAIPVERFLEQVRENPAKPIHWGSNQSGMQAAGEIGTPVKLENWEINIDPTKGKVGKRRDILLPQADAWEEAANMAAFFAEAFMKAGYHKQVVNRLMQQFQFMNTVMSATDFANFFHLRVHKDADPNIQELAECMFEAYRQSEPEVIFEGEWHTPYVDHQRFGSELRYFSEGVEVNVEDAVKISASCAAQASYRKLDASLEKALNIYERLVGGNPLHSSPFEHPATPFSQDEYLARIQAKKVLEQAGVDNPDLTMYNGNFRGWSQLRKMLPGENVRVFERDGTVIRT